MLMKYGNPVLISIMKYTCLLDVYSYSIHFLFYFLYFFLIAVVINFACFEKKKTYRI